MNAPGRHPRPVARFFLRWSRRTLVLVATLLVLLLAARVAAPFVLKNAINRRLARVGGYHGSVGDIDLALWRGAYAIDDAHITRRIGSDYQPFFDADHIDFSLAWRELFHGHIHGDIAAESVTLAYVPVPKHTSATNVRAAPWQQVIQDIFPIDVTRFEITRGRLAYRDDQADPPVDIALENLDLTVTGLRNRVTPGGPPLPAHLDLSGTSIGGGQVEAHADLAPLADQPTFDLAAQIERVDLPALNAYLRAYGNVDVSAGTFSLYSELAARDGHFEGYLKPFFADVSFKDLGESDKNLAQRLWESVVSGLVTLFKNKSRDELATRIPLSGDFSTVSVGRWRAFVNLLRNGFIQALTQRLEGSPDPDHSPASTTPSDASTRSPAPTTHRPAAP